MGDEFQLENDFNVFGDLELMGTISVVVEVQGIFADFEVGF